MTVCFLPATRFNDLTHTQMSVIFTKQGYAEKSLIFLRLPLLKYGTKDAGVQRYRHGQCNF